MSCITSRIDSVALIGAGTMGREIAWACARSGVDVRLFDVKPDVAADALTTVSRWLSDDGHPDSIQHLRRFDDLCEALAEVDLAFECVPEDLPLKRKVHAQISKVLPESALQGSNSSVLTPSEIADGLPGGAKFFCMNFTHIRSGERLAEYMGGPRSDPAIARIASEWALRIGMTPIVLEREILGYVQNRIWRAIKKEALYLAASGYASIEDIDRGFVLSWGVSEGPFRIMDKVGLDTVLRIEHEYFRRSGNDDDRPPAMLEDLVAEGKLGVQSGEGFYCYDNDVAPRQAK
ncbi:MAG TPA: 3-hydroxyacyl-CoA dehydrogenase family protein [Woeseiaceae bacterium]|nr:3-hydroxyacyl-CoA dehydrogenase family protein [Woeseiaceae bacterium]